MEQVAIKLKALRESTSPPVSVRAMALALGMPTSSYAFYEDANKFKKRYLPIELTKAMVAPLAAGGIEPSAVLALAGLTDTTDETDNLTDTERQILAALREASAEQTEAVQSMLSPAENPHPNAGRIVELLVERASPKQLQSVSRILSGRSDEIDVSIAAEQLDLVPVSSIDASYGMGATFIDDNIGIETRWFPRAWLATLTNTAPQNLTWARGRGNSMSPTIEDNDLVLIDRSDRSLRDQDAIWALMIGDMAMMKRLRVRGEQVTILSDNDRVPPDTAHLGEIHVVGRVSHIVRRV